jgi:flagellar hook-associated protein 3 FlgL
MRITQSMINENFTRNLMQNMKRLGDINDMISSTKKIRRPSDDPVGAAMALKLRRQIAAIEQYNSNAQDALTWMKDTETALANTGDILHRLNELTIQAANGPLTAEDREKILYEVKELKEQIFKEANSTSINRYLFSGYSTNKPPFTKDGDKVVLNPEVMRPNGVNIINDDGTGIIDPAQIDLNSIGNNVVAGKYRIDIANYDDIAKTADIAVLKLNDDGSETLVASGNGVDVSQDGLVIPGNQPGWNFKFNFDTNPIIADGSAELQLTAVITDGAIEYNLSQSERIPINLIGPEVFNDIFKAVEDLENAIETNDSAAISGQILENIKNSMSTVLKYRAQIGARSNRLEATVLRLDANEVDYLDLLSKTEDIDLARMITELKMEESIYRASLSVGARIIQPSLVDFLR